MSRGYLKDPEQTKKAFVKKPVMGLRHMLELYESMEKLSSIFDIGATPPVDILPILKYLPLPLFNNWRTKSSAVGEAIDRLYDPLVSHVAQLRSRNWSGKYFLDNVLDQ